MRNRRITMELFYNDWVGPRRKKQQVDLTVDEWIGWWEGTGVFEHRGPNVGDYIMARVDRNEPFSLDNIQLRQRQGGRKGMKKFDYVWSRSDSEGGEV